MNNKKSQEKFTEKSTDQQISSLGYSSCEIIFYRQYFS